MQLLARVLLIIILGGATNFAGASNVTVNFSVSFSQGSLAGTVAKGSFSYDSSIAPAGGGILEGDNLLTDLAFTFDGIVYDETSANTGAMNFQPDGRLAMVFFGSDCNANGYCSIGPDSNDWSMIAVVEGAGIFEYFDSNLGDYSSAPVVSTLLGGKGLVVVIDGVAPLGVLSPDSPDYFTRYLFDAMDAKQREEITREVGRIVPYAWSRNIFDTTFYVVELSQILEAYTTIVKRDGGSLVVLAHSWGSVLAYLAVLRNPDIHVDKFITLGSPLRAQTETAKEIAKSYLESAGANTSDLRSISNIGTWENYWTFCDPISGIIGKERTRKRKGATFTTIVKRGNTDIKKRGINPLACHNAYFEDSKTWGRVLQDVKR